VRWIPELKRTPAQGDRREVVKFAWLPVRNVEGFTVWWEKYTSVQHYNYLNGWKHSWAELWDAEVRS